LKFHLFNHLHMPMVFGWQTRQISPLPVCALLDRHAEADRLK